jgi:hypothetical protein
MLGVGLVVGVGGTIRDVIIRAQDYYTRSMKKDTTFMHQKRGEFPARVPLSIAVRRNEA